MAIPLVVPSLGESITEATVGSWRKSAGERVKRDEPVVELESEKATVELPAPADGVLTAILKKQGDTVKVGEVLGELDEKGAEAPKVMPAARRLAEERGVDTQTLEGTGKGGRVLKEDVMRAVAPAVPPPAPTREPAARERVVTMSPIRRTIAERLVQAQRTAAILTTFNECDMSAIMALRAKHQPRFQERHGIKLGFMSFFVKACIEALKAFPALNAEIRGNDIVYKDHYDIGVAVGGGKGLVVPVVKGADALSFAEVEQKIADLGKRAKENKLSMDELAGGTFTITNGGIYGSLLSTPILNPPQSGILGMHKIEERAVVVGGQIVARPMMYLALSYDHRLVDGREAVQFLVRVKECIEDPERILLEV